MTIWIISCALIPPLSAAPTALSQLTYPQLISSHSTSQTINRYLAHADNGTSLWRKPSPLKHVDNDQPSHDDSEFIYTQMKKKAPLTYSWLGFFTVYHSLAVLERSYFLATNQPLLKSGYFVKSSPHHEDLNYQRYITPFNLSLDVLSLIAIAAKPYRATLELVTYYETSSDTPAEKNQRIHTMLNHAAREQSSPRSLKSHLIRLGIFSSYALFIAFDYGDPHRAISYLVSGFLGGQIKTYLGPHYAPGILNQTLNRTSIWLDTRHPKSGPADHWGSSPATLHSSYNNQPYRLSIKYHL